MSDQEPLARGLRRYVKLERTALSQPFKRIVLVPLRDFIAELAVGVLSLMAVDTHGDEVLCSVVPQPAAKFPVMDLQVSNGPAQLTSPSIPL
jgi:hypothetical protein